MHPLSWLDCTTLLGAARLFGLDATVIANAAALPARNRKIKARRAKTTSSQTSQRADTAARRRRGKNLDAEIDLALVGEDN
jgi:hypothetical protein